MTEAETQAQLERFRAENEKLKRGDKGKLALRISEKGAVSVSGMGRFPVTLDKGQWLKLLSNAADIEQFIRDNGGQPENKGITCLRG